MFYQYTPYLIIILCHFILDIHILYLYHFYQDANLKKKENFSFFKERRKKKKEKKIHDEIRKKKKKEGKKKEKKRFTMKLKITIVKIRSDCCYLNINLIFNHYFMSLYIQYICISCICIIFVETRILKKEKFSSDSR